MSLDRTTVTAESISDRTTITLPYLEDKEILAELMNLHGISLAGAVRMALRGYARSLNLPCVSRGASQMPPEDKEGRC